ncbi:MAG: VanZ family protein [Verrucomicrobiaceae bacterium]|nr:VanZ family protein [Verrucomicrobiaceae bacterium]
MPRWLPFAFALPFIASIVYVADTRAFPGFFRWVASVPHLDKAGHFTLMGGLAWTANLALHHHRLHFGPLRVLTGSLIIVIAVSIEEYSQRWFPARTCDWKDLAADALGIVCASFLSPNPKS